MVGLQVRHLAKPIDARSYSSKLDTNKQNYHDKSKDFSKILCEYLIILMHVIYIIQQDTIQECKAYAVKHKSAECLATHICHVATKRHIVMSVDFCNFVGLFKEWRWHQKRI